jgi:hypothetical protein
MRAIGQTVAAVLRTRQKLHRSESGPNQRPVMGRNLRIGVRPRLRRESSQKRTPSLKAFAKDGLTLLPFVQNPLCFLLLRDLDSNPRGRPNVVLRLLCLLLFKKGIWDPVPRGRTFSAYHEALC